MLRVLDKVCVQGLGFRDKIIETACVLQPLGLGLIVCDVAFV